MLQVWVDLKEDIEFTQDDMEYYDNCDDQSGEEESSRGSSIFIFGTVFFSTISTPFFLKVPTPATNARSAIQVLTWKITGLFNVIWF
jgi:hypothetical protein